jgi:hypothetical protein
LATVRIYKVAELLDTTSQEVLALLKRDHGIELKSASSTLEEVVARSFVDRVARQRNISLPGGDMFAEHHAPAKATGGKKALAAKKPEPPKPAAPTLGPPRLVKTVKPVHHDEPEAAPATAEPEHIEAETYAPPVEEAPAPEPVAPAAPAHAEPVHEPAPEPVVAEAPPAAVEEEEVAARRRRVSAAGTLRAADVAPAGRGSECPAAAGASADAREASGGFAATHGAATAGAARYRRPSGCTRYGRSSWRPGRPARRTTSGLSASAASDDARNAWWTAPAAVAAHSPESAWRTGSASGHAGSASAVRPAAPGGLRPAPAGAAAGWRIAP